MTWADYLALDSAERQAIYQAFFEHMQEIKPRTLTGSQHGDRREGF